MPNIARISVSLEEDLLRRFDGFVRAQGYPTRSEAVKALIRQGIAERQWARGGQVAGAILLVYDHHKKDLTARLMEIQHDFGRTVLSTQHIHLDHANCLETVIVRDDARRIRRLVSRLKSVKGIKYSSFAVGASQAGGRSGRSGA